MSLQRDESGRIRAARMTAGRAKLLRLIIRGQRSGRAPSVRELCASLGGRSTNCVSEQLDKLEREGFIEREHRRQSRAVKVLAWPDGVPYDLSRGRADELRADLPERCEVEIAQSGYVGRVELVRVL